MYAVGHLALGYLSGRAASKMANVNTNIHLLFVASIIPDLDLLIPYFTHRGPTHSVPIFILLFLPTFLLCGKRVVPYFTALISHSVIGDLLTDEGVQLLWPINHIWYGGGIEATGLANILLEWFFFLAFLAVMLSTNDVLILFQRHLTNFLLLIPIFTVLLPTVLGFPRHIPMALFIPHLACLLIFTIPILIDLIPKKESNEMNQKKGHFSIDAMLDDTLVARASTCHLTGKLGLYANPLTHSSISSRRVSAELICLPR